MNHILMSANKPKGARPYFFEDKAVERVLNITMALAGEVAVMRERMDTVLREEIEHFQPTDAQSEQRQQIHAELIARVLRIIQQEIEAIQQPEENNKTMEEIAEILGRT
jgi:hypothetical protein